MTDPPVEVSVAEARPPGGFRATRRSGARFVRGSAGILVFLLAGEVIGRAGLVDRSYLPPTSTVLAHVGGLVTSAGFLGDVAFTLGGWSSGLLIATVIAVPAGLLLGSLPIVNSAARVLVEFLRPIPAVALVPLVLLFIADQGEMERALAAYAATWPILLNTIYGAGDVDPEARDMARCFGLSPAAILLRVSLPSVAPFAATGIRLASSVALIVTISTELISGSGGNGLGQFILDASGDPNGAADVFAAVVITGALGLLLDGLLQYAGRKAFRWHFERLGEAG
jgi:NitT/TauT family transport system permease protein